MRKQKILAQFSMVITTMIWGITFVMVKDALNDAPPYMFSSLRFGIAFILGFIYVNFSMLSEKLSKAWFIPPIH